MSISRYIAVAVMKCLLCLVALTDAPMELAEAEMAVGDEGAHSARRAGILDTACSHYLVEGGSKRSDRCAEHRLWGRGGQECQGSRIRLNRSPVARADQTDSPYFGKPTGANGGAWTCADQGLDDPGGYVGG
jgi:hypothetical protein